MQVGARHSPCGQESLAGAVLGSACLCWLAGKSQWKAPAAWLQGFQLLASSQILLRAAEFISHRCWCECCLLLPGCRLLKQGWGKCILCEVSEVSGWLQPHLFCSFSYRLCCYCSQYPSISELLACCVVISLSVKASE